MKNIDSLIIGTGIAGLAAALELAEQGREVVIITRADKPEDTNTYWAQGGIIFSPESANDVEKLVEDIVVASAHTSSIDAAKVLAKESGKIVKDVLIDKARAQFDKNESGEFLFTKEAAHSKERIIFHGDMTGKSIEVALLNYLNDQQRFPNLTILTKHTAIDLITSSHHGVYLNQRYEEHKVLGAFVFDQSAGVVKKLMAKTVVLATGGIGSLYLHHTNTEGARGDGHAMAHRAGAQITNMEFIQFHPTAFYSPSSHRRFLISEALRGEGARLINSSGEAFMHKYHKDCELAPRDVVSRAIVQEMLSRQDDCVYLDISHKDAEWLKQRFPTIYQYCLENKVDFTKEPIPVVPAAHYTCGGIKTNLKGETSVKHLFAVGEAACTGLHGANRLASTSLLEGVTWGVIVGEQINGKLESISTYEENLIRDWKSEDGNVDLNLIQQDKLTLKQTMWNYVGLTRSKNRLSRARAMFSELQQEVQRFYKNAKLHDELIGLRNSVEVAQMVVNASLRNQQSVGCFYLSEN